MRADSLQPAHGIQGEHGAMQRPTFSKDSGAVPKLSFASQNTFTPLRDLRDDDSQNLRGKQKASSPLEDQASPKKARDLTPQAAATETQSDEGPINMQLDPPSNEAQELHRVASDPVIYNSDQNDQTSGATGQIEQSVDPEP